MKYNRGFTLLEILVVVVIMGILASVIAPNFLDAPDKARIESTKVQMTNVANSLNMYKFDNSNYPSTEQGIEALVSQPSGFPEAKKWKQGGYMGKNRMPKDSWGNEFDYISPGLSGDAFDLLSYGADGKEGGEGTAADIDFAKF